MLGGGSWIKNQQNVEMYLKQKKIRYDVIGGLPYEEFLQTLSNYHGLCFHPLGFDTCPRIVIEAKVMGLELDLNDNVQHKDEKWFKDQTPENVRKALQGRPEKFWKDVNFGN